MEEERREEEGWKRRREEGWLDRGVCVSGEEEEEVERGREGERRVVRGRRGWVTVRRKGKRVVIRRMVSICVGFSSRVRVWVCGWFDGLSRARSWSC